MDCNSFRFHFHFISIKYRFSANNFLYQIASSLINFRSLMRKIFKFSLPKGKLLRQLFNIFYMIQIRSYRSRKYVSLKSFKAKGNFLPSKEFYRWRCWQKKCRKSTFCNSVVSKLYIMKITYILCTLISLTNV